MMKVPRLIAITEMILFASLLFADPQFSGEFTVGNLPDYDYLDLTAYNTAWFGLDSNWEICSLDEYLNISGSYNKKNYYYDHIADDQGTHGPDGTVVYALYKIQLRNEGSFFYFDWRDSDYKDGNGEFGTGYPTGDCRIYWKNSVYSYDSKFYCFYRGSSDTTFINDGDTLKLWEVAGKSQFYSVNKNHFQPTTPTNINLTYTSGCPVIHWNLSEPISAATYKIYREISSTPGYVQVASVSAGINQWTDNSFTIPNSSASYKIRAVSSDGNLESPNYSSVVQTDVKPTTPTNLSYSWSGGRINLIWHHSEPVSVARYEVWRKIMGGARYTQTIEDWTLICTTSAGDTTHPDREFYSGSGYKAYYKIRAVSGDGNLYSPGWSNEISIIGNFLPLDRQPSKKKLSIDTTPQFDLFPNPFNNTIQITLYSPAEEMSEIAIYDLQ